MNAFDGLFVEFVIYGGAIVRFVGASEVFLCMLMSE